MGKLQTLLRAVYPPTCAGCDAPVESEFGLCGPCRREAHFIEGLACVGCAAPLVGDDAEGAVLCDACLAAPRPWDGAAAAMVYSGTARRMILALKHADRLDVARVAAPWIARAARPIAQDRSLIVPVPSHWRRLATRRFNQSALLAKGVAQELGLSYCPDALMRQAHGETMEGRNFADRFASVEGAFKAHPRRLHRMAGRHVLLIDDVMTSGATLGDCTRACFEAGAAEVSVAVLARVAKAV